MALLARWMVRLLAAPSFYGAYRALPWLALGWALYGLYLVFIVIAGRARVTSRNFPAAAVGLAVNIVLLPAARAPRRRGPGHRGAGLALCGAYAAMLVVMYLLTRRCSRSASNGVRLAQLTAIFAGVAVTASCCCPPAASPASPCECVAGARPRAAPADALLRPARARAGARTIRDGNRRVRAFRSARGEVEAYAEDPLRDL